MDSAQVILICGQAWEHWTRCLPGGQQMVPRWLSAGEGKCRFMLGIVGNGGSCSHSCRLSGVTPLEPLAYWQWMRFFLMGRKDGQQAVYVCVWEAYICVCACDWVLVCSCVCTYVIVEMCIRTYVHVWGSTYVYLYLCVFHECLHEYICLCIYEHMYMHMYVYVWMWVCMCGYRIVWMCTCFDYIYEFSC